MLVNCRTRGRRALVGSAVPTANRLLNTTSVHHVTTSTNVDPAGGFKRGFIVSPNAIHHVMHRTKIATTSRIVRINPNLKSLALTVLRANTAVATIRVSPPLTRQLPNAITRFVPRTASQLAIIGQSTLAIAPRGIPSFDSSTSFALITGLPCGITAPVLLALLRHFSGLISFLIVIRGRITSELTTGPNSGVCNAPDIGLT